MRRVSRRILLVGVAWFVTFEGILQLPVRWRKSNEELAISEVCFITGATRGIGAEIAKTALAARNKVMAIVEKLDGKTANWMKQVGSEQYHA